MSIQAFPIPVDEREETVEQEEPTMGLQLDAAEPILDALPLLDNRTRTQALDPKLAPRGHYIEFQDGDEIIYVPLGRRITHIGRGFTADLRIEHSHVSVSHAILVRHGRFMRVLDDRSSNGTFVNGRRIIATNLQDGDVLRVGPIVMRYIVVS